LKYIVVISEATYFESTMYEYMISSQFVKSCYVSIMI